MVTKVKGAVFNTKDVEGAVSIKEFGAVGDGVTDDYQAFVDAEEYCRTNVRNLYLPNGTYNIYDKNMPFRHSVTSSLLDYKGITIIGESRKNTIVKTEDSTGADVFNFQAVQNISLRNFTITADITASSTGGSNGVSIISGGVNIDIDCDFKDILGHDNTSNLDGGKAVTIQNGVGVTNNFRNIRVRGDVTNCGYGFGIDARYSEFDASVGPVYEGIDVDMTVNNCWVGYSLNVATPSGTLTYPELDSGVRLRGNINNCAISYFHGRWLYADTRIHVVTNKTMANLYRPVSGNQDVYVASILGDYGSNIDIRGRVEEVNHKLIMGGVTMGGYQYEGCDGTDLNFRIEAGTVASTEFDILTSSSNDFRNCRIWLDAITTGGESVFLNDSNMVHVAGQPLLGDRKSFSTATDGDAHPSVKGIYHLKTANTSSTTINDFDDWYTGQEILVVIDDNNTTVDFTGTSLRGNGGSDWSPTQYDHMRCTVDEAGLWYCQVTEV